MARDLGPESVIKALDKGCLAPFYLFYGPGEFRMEKLLDRIRASAIPESVRDFNMELFYGGEASPGEIILKAKSMPFMSKNRLIMVRRTELFGKEDLERFLPYLENPSESTCLIFISGRADFSRKFYKEIRARGLDVKFASLKEEEVLPWVKQTAKELGLQIDEDAADYLASIVGNNPRELYGELEKLRLRFSKIKGIDPVKELVMHSRIYSIFELMEMISTKNCDGSLKALERFLAEGDRRLGPLQVLGMLNRQLRLLWQTKEILMKGGGFGEVADKLGRNRFKARDFMGHAKHWSTEQLQRGVRKLYEADGGLKSGSRPKPVLEEVIISLCREKEPS
jgi:DNA polymerase-3 subunit delta